ncbi:MAG: hypothetical protein ACHQ9S_19945 [Candidatus Binatia bacterium]
MVTFIAYRQWRTAQNALTLNLFNRRLVVYKATQAFISSILSRKKVLRQEEEKWLKHIRSVEWLFNEHIANYLQNEIWNLANTIHALESSAAAGNEQNYDKQAALLKQLSEHQSVTMKREFRRFLSMRWI